MSLIGQTALSSIFAFDQLQSGQEYDETLPVIHIGFTDFTLFPNDPEFYATYRMTNVKKPSQVYSDKFTLSVVDLTQIDNATEDDKTSKIDHWAVFSRPNAQKPQFSVPKQRKLPVFRELASLVEEFVVQRFDGDFEILHVYAEDDVQLAGALVDHITVDAGLR